MSFQKAKSEEDFARDSPTHLEARLQSVYLLEAATKPESFQQNRLKRTLNLSRQEETVGLTWLQVLKCIFQVHRYERAP